MLSLRLQRVGRKKLPQYRLIAQEHSLQPTSGKVAAYLGTYNPHSKEVNINKEEVEKYLGNGAQPTNRVAILLKKEGVKLPKWVEIKEFKKKSKQPEEEKPEAPAEATEESKPAEEAQAEPKAEEPAKEEAESK